MLIDKHELKWSIAILLVLLIIFAFANDESDVCGGAAGQTSAECL